MSQRTKATPIEWGLLLALLAVFTLLIWHDYTRDDPEYYSLIVTDFTGQQWAVDYNLTLPDCSAMQTTEAATCTLQPEGKI